MKKFAPSMFSGEEEEEDDVVLADHHPPLLDNDNLQIISCDHGSQASSSNSTVLDDHDGGDEDIPPVVYNPTPLRWFRPPTADFSVLDDQNNLEVDEVDTTLRLFRNNSTPVHPDFFDGVEDDDADTTLSLRLPDTTNHEKSRKHAKGKKRAVAFAGADDSQKKKRLKREDNEALNPLLPIEQIATLMKAVESRNGSRPIFLYRKMLEMSDVEKGQNRLLVTRRERMMDYLREEAAAVDDGKGLKIVGVDGGGNVYHNLVLKRWRSTDGTVIKSDWRKVVAANSAQKGDVVEIWGFRVDDKPCLAFNFIRRENAGSSGTTCIDDGTSQRV